MQFSSLTLASPDLQAPATYVRVSRSSTKNDVKDVGENFINIKNVWFKTWTSKKTFFQNVIKKFIIR